MTTDSITFILVFIVAVLGASGGILIYRWFDRLLRRIGLLEDELTRLQVEDQQRKQTLIQAAKRSRKHHSYSTAEGLEDAMAVMIDAAINLEAEQARVATALGILQQVRRGPHAYKTDERNER